MEFTILTNAQVIQLSDNPTRAFEARYVIGGMVIDDAITVLLVGDPVKPPPHWKWDHRPPFKQGLGIKKELVMAVEQVTMYRVVCDRCGQGDDSEFYAWVDSEQALMVADESDWLVRDDGQWCPACTTWDEDADEEVPLPAMTDA